MSNPTSEAMEAGLRAVREMADGPAPANDAPNAAGDDVRVEAIARALFSYSKRLAKWEEVEDFWHDYWREVAKAAIAADPATSRIRALESGYAEMRECWVAANEKITALEEANRALVAALEKTKRWLESGLSYDTNGSLLYSIICSAMETKP